LGGAPCRTARNLMRTPHPLDSRQQAPPRYGPIRQPAADIQPVGMLRQSARADVGPAAEPLAHHERLFDFRPDLRLRPVFGPRLLTQRSMATRVGLNEALSMGRVVRQSVTVSARDGIPPHPCLLAMPRLRQHLTVRDSDRHGHDQMTQLRLTVHAERGPSYRNPTGCPSSSAASSAPAPWCNFFVKLGAVMMVASTMVPRLTVSPWVPRYAPIRAKNCSPNRWISHRCRT
jgi:hypothetical protein